MKIQYSINFVLEKRKDQSGQPKADALIKMRIKYAMGMSDFSTGYKADVAKWITAAQLCKAATTHGKKKTPAAEINAEINRLRALAEDTFKAFEVAGNVPDLKDFKKAFNIANGRQVAPEIVTQKSFFECFDEFCHENGRQKEWTDSTYKKFHTLKAHLQAFRPDIDFGDLNEAGLTQFIDYLRSIPIPSKKKKSTKGGEKILPTIGMRNSSVGKLLGFIRWFLRWASSKGYNTNTDYLTYRPKMKTSQKTIVFLDWDELMHLYKLTIPESKTYLERVRDVFCFCCFTSLRYSDVYNLRRSNINNDSLEITTVKTADKLIIELNKYAKEILCKYDNIPFPDDKALPVISNQKMNNYLKELGKFAGFDTPIRTTHFIGNKRIDETHAKYELIGTHTARRTFICNALALGIPANVIMEWTGHADYKAMMPYIDVANTVKKSMMERFNQE